MIDDRRPLIYLACPIDWGDDQTRALHRQATQQMDRQRLTTYQPVHAWTAHGTPRREIEQINWFVMGKVDGGLALLPRGVKSVGVPMEIERMAFTLGIPVAVVGDGLEQSWALTARSRARIFEEDQMDLAVDWLKGASRLEMRRRAAPGGGRFQVKVAGEGQLPTRAYDDDAGFDLYCSENTYLGAGERASLPTGISMEFPNGWWGMVVGRSSAWSHGLMVKTSVIDPGWRGPLFVDVMNINREEKVEIRKGERIGQIVPFNNTAATIDSLVRVDQLSTSERGMNGYGSSGR